MIEYTPVVLCGGSGTRLWPLSRAGFPKQFLSFGAKHSLFQQTVLRLQSLANDKYRLAQRLIVTQEDQRFMALEQLREADQSTQPLGTRFLLEPCARNTAAALTLAALQATQDGQDNILVASPADAYIGDDSAYQIALRSAISLAVQGDVVILGIDPTRAETGYGYIRYAQPGVDGARQVLQFVEKPNQALAEKYIAQGDYAWNSGMFVLRASVWLESLQNFRPDIFQTCQAAWHKRLLDQPLASHVQFIRPDADLFAQVPSESVDYAVMEKCPGSAFPIKMQTLDAKWSDLGAWDAVWQISAPDVQGNVAIGDVFFEASQNNYVHSSGRLVSIVGVENLVVVETSDAVLVSDKSCSQDVKKIVDRLGRDKRSEHSLHRKVHRPWGWYDSVDEGNRHKVKRIHVKPGASLSLQKHAHRAEHWIVVKGVAQVTCGEKIITLLENQSTYIAQGQVHRLSNQGDTELEIIEVQSGSYLGEDDIVRLEDSYGRK